MLKKVFSHVGVSLAIGWAVTTVCMWSFGAWQADGMAVMRMYTVWLFASALYGLISLVYDTELPLPLAIAIHFIGCAAITNFLNALTYFREMVNLPPSCILAV